MKLSNVPSFPVPRPPSLPSSLFANQVKKDPDMDRKIEAKLKRKPIQPCWTKRGEGRGDEVEESAPVWELKERPGWY